MTIAQLCDYLKPDTLAKIVVDLGDGPCTPESEQARQTVLNALQANVGDV